MSYIQSLINVILEHQNKVVYSLSLSECEMTFVLTCITCCNSVVPDLFSSHEVIFPSQIVSFEGKKATLR